MNRQSAFAVACAASATAILGLIASPAQAVSLGELIRDNETFTDGGLTFSNFSFQFACLDFNDTEATCEELFEAGNVRPISPFQITVGPATTPHGPGIQFIDFFRAEDGYGIDLAISYDVESTVPINKFYLNFDAVLDSGRVEIIETVTSNGNPTKQLFADNITGGDFPDLADSDTFSTPVTQFSVLKDINLTSVPGTGPSIMSTIDQEYAPVPEPLTILGSAAALGFGVAFKKQHSRNKKNIK
jgi:hypothetical protein